MTHEIAHPSWGEDAGETLRIPQEEAEEQTQQVDDKRFDDAAK